MNKFNEKKNLNARDIFYRICVGIAAILLVVYFMPREGRSAYQFDLGRPWRYSQLIATFDFPIYKSDELIKKEQDSVMHLFEPYFEINQSVEEEQVAKFRKDFAQMEKSGIPYYYKGYIEQKLRTLYQNGIVQPDDYNRLVDDSITAIRIFTANQSVIRPTKDIYSHKSAYKFFFETDDTARYDRLKLQKCNLDRYIVSNLLFDQKKSEEQKKDLLSSISYASGMVMSGQKIIDRGDIVTQETYNILASYLKESKQRIDSTKQEAYLLVGQILCVALIFLCMMLYFSLFRKDYLEKGKSVLLLLTMLVIFPVLSSILVDQNLFSVYIIPFTMAPIFIRVFMDSRTAFVMHTVIICCAPFH